MNPTRFLLNWITAVSIKLIFLTVFLVIVILCLFLMGILGGKEKFSSPSGSSRQSKISGSFIRQGKIENISIVSSDEKIELKEAWIEKIIEYYESVPFRKGFAGERLCVGIQAENRETVWTILLFTMKDGEPVPYGKTRSVSRSVCVLALGEKELNLKESEFDLCLCTDRHGKNVLAKFQVRFD